MFFGSFTRDTSNTSPWIREWNLNRNHPSSLRGYPAAHQSNFWGPWISHGSSRLPRTENHAPRTSRMLKRANALAIASKSPSLRAPIVAATRHKIQSLCVTWSTHETWNSICYLPWPFADPLIKIWARLLQHTNTYRLYYHIDLTIYLHYMYTHMG